MEIENTNNKVGGPQNPWPGIIGPCYVAQTLQEELDVTRQELVSLVENKQILSLITSDGLTVYPAFQIRDNHIIPGLDIVLQELAKGMDSPLMWAQWLNKPRKGQFRRIDELADGQVEKLVLEAKNIAAAWAS